MQRYPTSQSSSRPPINPWGDYDQFLALAKREGIKTSEDDSVRREDTLPPDLDTELIEFAARVAWRNSNRCIGRLVWQTLAVRDFRHVSCEESAFDALLSHLRLATNGGKIKPVLTVFPSSDCGKPGIKVLNHQLIRYAGYRARDGSILGDPQNERLTESALTAGWVPPSDRSAFDLLPVLIQMNDRPIRAFELPHAEVLQVRLRHPRLGWFEDLGLRWYAVPVITDMSLDAAGRRHPYSPFSGWYMGSEIGARNLADANRYNLLPLVAERMGLDLKKSSSLWKDQALVELNIAVLHSYESEGVTIVDHHRASSQFMRFVENERRSGRDVTGDWSWLVPPLSGATCPMFHQSLDHTEKYPALRPQPSV